ncbi:glycosyltransferase, partial [Klebsiella pneumoniae]|nr:glycosyltransferase [Klebsiella pneumoniae]
QKQWAKQANPLVRVLKIPNGVNLEQFSPDVHPLKTSLKKPIIICAGALEQSKRIDMVIKAVAMIPKASLLLVGTGSEQVNLRKMAQE